MFASSPVIGQRFAFAHGRTGVLQQSLLTQSDIDRLLGTHDRHEMQQVLTELRFTKLIDQSLRDENDILGACQAWVRAEVTSMTPKELQSVFNILWIDGDLPLLSYLLKQKKGLTSSVSREPQSPYTAYNTASVHNLVDTGEKGDLPDQLVSFVRGMIDETITDPRLIDVAVAQYAADTKLLLAKKSRSSAILRFVRHQIDAQNIRTLLRFAPEDRSSVGVHLVHGGTITPSIFLTKSGTIAGHVRMAGLYALADVIEKSDADDAAVERALDAILAGDIAVLWNTILSIESLFAFAATALTQINVLRAIVIGKRNDIGPQDIKRMMPHFLSASHYVL